MSYRNNRGLTQAERQQHTILTNRAALHAPVAPACPCCQEATRITHREGYLWRVCKDRSCHWIGECLATETSVALAGMPEAERARVMTMRTIEVTA